MSSIITSKLRILNAQNFLASVVSTPIYLAIGNTLPWATEPNPPEIQNEDSINYLFWKNIIGLKRIKPVNASLNAINRKWAANTIYDEYRHNYSTLNVSSNGATTLQNALFYVVNGTNIYKCISNNYGAISTVAPTGTSVNFLATSDGYIWKYMGTVDNNNLAYTQVYPDSNVISAAISGALSNIRLLTGGTGYTQAIVTISGDGAGATASAIVAGGEITGIHVNSLGKNYTYATINIIGDGSNATAEAIISPQGGHGSDIISELFVDTVQINMELSPSDSTYFTKTGEYRSISLISNPLTTGQLLDATNDYYDCTYNLTLTSVSTDYTIGETVIGLSSLVKGYVVDWNPITNVLRVAQNEITGDGAFTLETIVGQTSGATGAANIVNLPQIESNTGKMLYLNAMAPITRHALQTDSINIFINF